MKEIEHQTQPTSVTCTSACLAMILGVPVTDVVEEFHEDWIEKKTDPAHYLIKKGVKFQIHREPYDSALYYGKVYLLTVPSLNVMGRNHHILIDMRRGEGEEIVYDPCHGRKGKSYYVGWSKKKEHATEEHILSGWAIDLILDMESSHG